MFFNYSHKGGEGWKIYFFFIRKVSDRVWITVEIIHVGTSHFYWLRKNSYFCNRCGVATLRVFRADPVSVLPARGVCSDCRDLERKARRGFRTCARPQRVERIFADLHLFNACFVFVAQTATFDVAGQLSCL